MADSCIAREDAGAGAASGAGGGSGGSGGSPSVLFDGSSTNVGRAGGDGGVGTGGTGGGDGATKHTQSIGGPHSAALAARL